MTVPSRMGGGPHLEFIYRTGPIVKSQHLSESVGEMVRFQRRVNIGIMHGSS